MRYLALYAIGGFVAAMTQALVTLAFGTVADGARLLVGGATARRPAIAST